MDNYKKLHEDIYYDEYDDYNVYSNKSRGGGKSKNNTKKDAKHNKKISCYSSKHIRKIVENNNLINKNN